MYTNLISNNLAFLKVMAILEIEVYISDAA
jgi:hypothetical protein